jgi:threonine aldolase
MSALSRRAFLKTGGVAAALSVSHTALPAASARADTRSNATQEVHFLYDGIMLTPAEYSELLLKLAQQEHAQRDIYLSGGAVQTLETTFAKALGKESAVFVPTGTLANHLALRFLAGDATRVIVPAESHIYNDSNDCVETLSRLNLVALGAGRATYTLAEVQDAVDRARHGPYPLRVGALCIESPVRRKRGEVFDHDEMRRISEFARKNGIGMHLDGARLYMASAYTGISPAEYASLFDTVYISLYKYFNAGTGAVLAGPKSITEKVAHARKVFGAGLFQAWMYAAVALYHFDGFPERFAKAVRTANELCERLQAHGGFRKEPITHGSNIFRLHVQGVDAFKYRDCLLKEGIRIQLSRPSNDADFLLTVNESLNRRTATELARSFVGALAASK